MPPQRLQTASWTLQPSLVHQKRPVLLLVNDSLPTAVNGIMTVMRSLEASAIGAGYDVVHLDPTQFPHRSCPLYPEFKLSWPTTIGTKIRAAKPSYIHIVTEGPLGVAAALYCTWHGVGFNSAYHTRLPEYTAALSGLPQSLCHFVVRAYVRWCHRASHCVLTTTPAMAHALASYGLQVPIATMPFGVDRRLFRADLRRPRETNASGPILLSVGRVSKEKGLDAFCDLDYPGATKIVVGDGAYRSELEARYPEIQFVGLKTGDALAEYYANADVLVFTSRTDTFGLVMIESLACGTPVAAFPVPGPLDAIECGVTGHLSEDLCASIDVCLGLDRAAVAAASQVWSWDHCWATFEKHLVPSDC